MTNPSWHVLAKKARCARFEQAVEAGSQTGEIAAAEPVAPLPTIPARKTKGCGHPPTLLTDDEVRAARRMHEIDGKSPAEVAEHFKLKLEYTYQLLAYTVRSRILI